MKEEIGGRGKSFLVDEEELISHRFGGWFPEQYLLRV